ncbi:hypothetical protein [Streptomyces sp. NPDC000880]
MSKFVLEKADSMQQAWTSVIAVPPPSIADFLSTLLFSQVSTLPWTVGRSAARAPTTLAATRHKAVCKHHRQSALSEGH